MSDAVKNWDYSLPILLIVAVPIIMILFGGYLSGTAFLLSKKNKLPLNVKKFSIGLGLVAVGLLVLLTPMRI